MKDKESDKRIFATLKQKMVASKQRLENKKSAKSVLASDYTSDMMPMANLAFKAAVTSLAITFAVTPLRITVKNQYLKDGEVRLPFIYQFRVAIGPSITSGFQRSTVSVGGKHVTTNEAMRELKQESEAVEKGHPSITSAKSASTSRQVSRAWAASPFAQAMTFAQADILLSSYHGNAADLAARNIQIPRLSLSGMFSVIKIGYAFKSASGLANFYSMIQVADAVETVLPRSIKEHATYGKYISGAVSGAISAVITFPIGHMLNKVSAEATYNPATDRIDSPNSIRFFKSEFQGLMQTGVKQSMQEFALFAMRGPLPVAMLQSMIIFSLLNGMNTALGETPVEDLVGKFSS